MLTNGFMGNRLEIWKVPVLWQQESHLLRQWIILSEKRQQSIRCVEATNKQMTNTFPMSRAEDV
jgi:hypothetical protein